jgi:hypothetical protein
MKKNTLKEISRTLDYDSSIATIKLLLVSNQEHFNKKHLNCLMEIISWNAGFADNPKDSEFLYKLMKKAEKKINKYFYKKDLKEMAEYKASL